MRGVAKMMAITAVTRDKDRRDYDRTDMAMPYMGGDYDIQDRFRDRRGREHYDNGRYAPRNESTGTLTWDTTHDAERRKHEPMDNYPRYEMDEMESRRRRDRRGRFRSEMDEPDMHYPGPYPFPPPVYERRERGQDMNPIGFAVNAGFREVGGDYKQDAEYKRMNEMEYRSDPHVMRGGASGGVVPLDEEMAHEWMKGLKNEDGTHGPHWSKDQVKQVMKQQNWDADEMEAWVALNAMYSDYFNVARKHNVNNLNFYVDLAKAFMGDKDAKDDKLALYYCYIVK